MRKLLTFIIILICFLNYSCRSNDLKGNLKYDYTTSGALGEDCFQVIITAMPENELKTMTDQRENAFIKAKNSITAETEKQMIAYYSAANSAGPETLSGDNVNLVKKKSAEYSI